MDKYEVLEQFTCSKTGKQETNEDVIFVNDKFVAVIDGATSKGKGKINNATGGHICADVIAKTLFSLNGNESAKEVFNLLFFNLRKSAEDMAFSDNGIECCAVAVIYSVMRHELWSVGDCQYSVNGRNFDNSKRIDDVISKMRAIYIRALLMNGMTESELLKKDISREAILPFLEMQKYLENTDDEYGYSVINDKSLPVHVSVTEVPGNAEIILASDGYPVVYGSLKESEDYLQKCLDEDPLCYRTFVTTKGKTVGNVSFDDRSYIRFRLIDA